MPGLRLPAIKSRDAQMRQIWRERHAAENYQRSYRGQNLLPMPIEHLEPEDRPLMPAPEIRHVEDPPESEVLHAQEATEAPEQKPFYPIPEIGRTPAEQRRTRCLQERF